MGVSFTTTKIIIIIESNDVLVEPGSLTEVVVDLAWRGSSPPGS